MFCSNCGAKIGGASRTEPSVKASVVVEPPQDKIDEAKLEEELLKSAREAATAEKDRRRRERRPEGFLGRVMRGVVPGSVSGSESTLPRMRRLSYMEGRPPMTEALVAGVAANAVSELLKQFWKSTASHKETLRLRNQDLVSAALVTNTALPSDLRDNVATLRTQIHTALRTAAVSIEKGGFKTLQQALEKKNLGAYLRERADTFVYGQEGLRVSYRSVVLTFQVFQKVNEEILKDIERVKRSGDDNALMSALLMNAVFVVEVADALAVFLEEFKLDGIEHIEKCRQEILDDIDENAREDKAFKEKYLADSATADVALYSEHLDLRERYRKTVKELWDKYMEYVENMRANVTKYKEKVRSLRAADTCRQGCCS